MNIFESSRPSHFTLTCTTLHLNRPRQLDIPTASPNIDRVLALLQLPLLRNNVPNTQIPPGNREGNGLRGAASKMDALETTQLSSRRSSDVHIQLRDFARFHGARVGDFHADVEEDFPEVCRSTLRDRSLLGRVLVGVAAQRFDGEVCVGEVGVRQAVAEFETWGDVVFVEVAVVNVKAFGEVDLRVRAEADGGVEEVAVVGLVLGDCEGHAAGWRDIAEEDVRDRVADFLAWEAGVEDGRDVRAFAVLVIGSAVSMVFGENLLLDPGVNGPDASVVDGHNRVRAVGGHVLDELVAEFVLERPAVKRFASVCCDRVGQQCTLRLTVYDLPLMKTRQASELA
jgi:hypothetical protein